MSRTLSDKQIAALLRGMLHYPAVNEPRLNFELGALDIAKGLDLIRKELEHGNG